MGLELNSISKIIKKNYLLCSIQGKSSCQICWIDTEKTNQWQNVLSIYSCKKIQAGLSSQNRPTILVEVINDKTSKRLAQA